MQAFKVRVKGYKNSELVQKHAFKLGWEWKCYPNNRTEITILDGNCIYLEKDGSMHMGPAGIDCPNHKDIPVEDFLRLPIVTKDTLPDGKEVYTLEFSDSIIDPKEKLKIANDFKQSLQASKIEDTIPSFDQIKTENIKKLEEGIKTRKEKIDALQEKFIIAILHNGGMGKISSPACRSELYYRTRDMAELTIEENNT